MIDREPAGTQCAGVPQKRMVKSLLASLSSHSRSNSSSLLMEIQLNSIDSVSWVTDRVQFIVSMIVLRGIDHQESYT